MNGICMEYAWDMHRIRMEYAWNMHDTWMKKYMEYECHMVEYTWNIPEYA